MFGISGILSTVGALGIVAVILAIVAVVLAFIFIVPENKRAKLNKFGQFLHDTLNFKFLIVEKILKALYIFFTAFFILTGFFMLFMVVKNPFTGSLSWYGIQGLLTMIISPIVVRLIFELTMMAVLLVKNTISINNKLKNQNEQANSDDPFASPDLTEIKESFQQKKVPVAENASFCPNCGSPLGDGDFCPSCGTKVK